MIGPTSSLPLDDRAVITLALGPAIYRAMAVNLARSIRRWHSPETMAIILVTDDPAPLPGDLRDVRLKIIQPAELGVGFQTKLHLDRLAPARQTLFIDADCLVYGPLDALFARLAGRPVATVGGAISEGEWFGDVGALCRRLGVPAIPKFNGGLYYLEPGGVASAVYHQARELAGRYDELGLVRLRGHPNDELIMAGAMALAGLSALPDDGTIMSDPQCCPGPLQVNVLRGRRRLVNPPPPSPLHQAWYPFTVVEPLVVHFLGHHVRSSTYRAEALRLKLAARGWPAPVAQAIASWGVDLPGRAKDWTKATLRPIFHRLAGHRAVRPAPR
jgi:hypothetical protein